MAKTRNVEKILAARMKKKTMQRSPGTYSLIIRVDEEFTGAGPLGDVGFGPGFYVYTDKAKDDIESRIRRIRKTGSCNYKIDVLLQHGTITNVLVHKSGKWMDDPINRKVGSLKGAVPIPEFLSDRLVCCLYHFKKNPIKRLRGIYSDIKGKV